MEHGEQPAASGHAAGHAGGMESGMESGDAVVGRPTTIGAAIGLAVGMMLGGALGYAHGIGRVSLPGLAFLAAGGAGVSAVVVGALLAAAVGLVGALWGTARESDVRASAEAPRAESGAPHDGSTTGAHGRHHGPSGDMRIAMRLPLIGAALLAAYMAYTLLTIAQRAEGGGTPSDQSNRVGWNQKNVTRVGGRADAATAEAALRIAYPGVGPTGTPRTRFAASDWRLALAATPLIARPTDAAIMTGGGAAPPGSRVLSGDPNIIADEADRERNAVAPAATAALVVAADADPRWALPAGAYAARTGTPILFAERGTLSAPARAVLARRSRPRVYLLGPDDVMARVAEALRDAAVVTRVGGDDPTESAVRFAELFDPADDFGWGRTGSGVRRFASPSTILVNPARWQDAIAAAHLARRGKAGPILYVERDRLPPVVENFLWRQRPAFADTPEEGPYAHAWVVGGFDRVSYATQARADYALEIEQYMTLGDSATSGFEALAIAWLALSIASAVWVFVHAGRRVRGLMPMMRAAWVVLALLLGPIAVWMYVASYHRRARMEHEGMTAWKRGRWGEAIVATAMMFAFDMMLMCLAVFALAERGFPIVRAEGPLSILGSSMFLMMVGMYVIALALMLLVFHAPMQMHEKRIPSYWKALAAGAPLMIATMTVESIGMMPTMWWAQMSFLPNMQMPTADDVTMWGTLLLGVLAGLALVLPFNYWLVARGSKRGTM